MFNVPYCLGFCPLGSSHCIGTERCIYALKTVTFSRPISSNGPKMAFGSLLGIASGTEIVGPPRPVRLLSAPLFCLSLWTTQGGEGYLRQDGGRRAVVVAAGELRGNEPGIHRFLAFPGEENIIFIMAKLVRAYPIRTLLSLPHFRSFRSLPMQGKEESQQANCFVPSLPLSFFTPPSPLFAVGNWVSGLFISRGGGGGAANDLEPGKSGREGRGSCSPAPQSLFWSSSP